MIFMNYKVIEHFKDLKEENIKLNIQKMVTGLIINEKISSS